MHPRNRRPNPRPRSNITPLTPEPRPQNLPDTSSQTKGQTNGPPRAVFDNLWFVAPNGTELLSPYNLHAPGAEIAQASAFTVSLLTTVMAKDYDALLGRDNDVLVYSESRMNHQPDVQRLHFFEKELPVGTPIRNTLADNVFLCDDYRGEKLWLKLNMVEVDTHHKADREAALRALTSLAGTAGAIFPALLPYALGTAVAGGIVGRILDALTRDTPVIEVPVALHPGAGSIGRAPLQAGVYVAFSQDIDPAKFRMNRNGLLTRPDRGPVEVSYAAFDIRPINSPSPALLLNQKTAALLQHLRSDQGLTSKNILQAAQETLAGYLSFQKLRRYQTLRQLEHPTAAETNLLARMATDEQLKPFLDPR